LSPEISIRDLHFSYPALGSDAEPIPVLKGVDLEVEQGEFVSIMGRTGVGKTTLCLTLNGIVPQSTGGTIRGEVVVAFRTLRASFST
jgi:energy-coupling factor transporter ATP-binding protein EcfA2